MQPIGLLGGTFDPIHFGHLRIALEVREATGMEQVRLVPAAQPPHRETPGVTAEQRLEMVRAAVADEPALCVDDRELRRDGPSYTVDTLAELRAEFPRTPICFILGSDAFQSLDSWHEWQRIFELAHLVIAARPGWRQDESSELGRQLGPRFVDKAEQLTQRVAGSIFSCPVSQLAISATGIRRLLATGRNPRYLLPDVVLDLIYRNELYQRS